MFAELEPLEPLETLGILLVSQSHESASARVSSPSDPVSPAAANSAATLGGTPFGMLAALGLLDAAPGNGVAGGRKAPAPLTDGCT
jgi:hypothetical protein